MSRRSGAFCIPRVTLGGVQRNGVTDCDVLDLTLPDAFWAGSVEEENGNRWMVVCPHGSLVSTPDRDMATWLAAHPREFCEQHR
jgi:hypothetical protein